MSAQIPSAVAFPGTANALTSPQAISEPSGAFGSLAIKTNNVSGAAEWQRVLKRIEKEATLYDACDDSTSACPGKVRAWRKSIRLMDQYNGWDLLAAVNGKVNKLIEYRDDLEAYGRIDHWASPAEALTGQGDCEDYAILKYISLLELGLDDSQMRIVVVKDTRRNIGHAVLSVSMNGQNYILDSLRQRPMLDSKLSSYVPHYSVNRQGQWLNLATRKRDPNIAGRKAIKVTFSRPLVIAKPRPKPTRLARVEN